MAGNEKTFEQGVAVGMLLSKGSDQGPKTYDLKDQLFKYILENGKIIGTCKFGNSCIKAYIGIVHYSDPNAKLFWKLTTGIRSSSINIQSYTKEYDDDPNDPKAQVLSIAPLLMTSEGIIAYVTNIFFSEDDKPLFGSIEWSYNDTNINSVYIYNTPDGNSGSKAIACWPSYIYSGLEEAIESVEYTGDIEHYIYADTVVSGGRTRLRVTDKYKDSSGAETNGYGKDFNIVCKRSSTNWIWHKTTGQNSDGETVIIDDMSKPPVITKNNPSDYNIRMRLYYNVMPNPMMTADNLTDKDIAKAVANAYDSAYKNAEGPAASKLLRAEVSHLLTPQ